MEDFVRSTRRWYRQGKPERCRRSVRLPEDSSSFSYTEFYSHQSEMVGGIFIPIFKEGSVNDMSIPEKVKVLYKEYTVEEQQNLHDEEGDLYGLIQYLPEKIVLNADASEEQKKSTLVHELLHALDEMYSIELEEKQVEKLGNALYMLHCDNPQLFHAEGGDND